MSSKYFPEIRTCGLLRASVLMCTFYVSSCSIFKKSKNEFRTVSFEHQVEVQDADGQSFVLEAKKPLELTKAIYIVSSPGRMPLSLLQTARLSNKTAISLKKISVDYFEKDLVKQQGEKLDQLVIELAQLQSLILKQSWEQALQMSQRLITRFPEVPSLRVIYASVALKTNNRASALSELKKALQQDANHAQAREFYRKLTGSEYFITTKARRKSTREISSEALQ